MRRFAPPGDVVLCDIAREAASVLLAELEDIGVPEHGSISVEHPKVVLSRAAERAERAAPGAPTNAVVWEELEELTSESTELSASFIIFMSLATLIASVGIFLDTPILIIGAMVLGPEFGPLASFCVALVEGRAQLAWRSLLALLAGFPLAIAVRSSPRCSSSGPASPRTRSRRTTTAGGGHQQPRLLLVLRRVLRGHRRDAVADDRQVGRTCRSADLGDDDPGGGERRGRGRLRGLVRAGGSLAQLGINVVALCIASIGTLIVQRNIFERRRAAYVRGRL